MKTSGILLPIFSLPSDYGIGCFSKEAYKFVDFLEEAGQKYWQILPLGTIGAGNSPYLSFSSFAGSNGFFSPFSITSPLAKISFSSPFSGTAKVAS